MRKAKKNESYFTSQIDLLVLKLPETATSCITSGCINTAARVCPNSGLALSNTWPPCIFD